MTQHHELRAQTIWLEDDILRARMRPGVFDLELADAEQSARMVEAVWGSVRRPILIDTRGMRSMSRDCRKYFAGPETARLALAVALLTPSPLTRAIGNFFMGINRALVPTRLFTSEEEALVWLRQFVR